MVDPSTSSGNGSLAGPVDARPSISVRYFAAAAEAAGREAEVLEAVESVGRLRAVLIATYGDPMARVLASGSFLVDGVVSRDDTAPLGPSTGSGTVRVDVLPPFAGG